MTKLGFIGAGNMAEAIIKGVKSSPSSSDIEIFISDKIKQRLDALVDTYGVSAVVDNKTLAASCDHIIIAVKPLNVGEALGEIKGVLKSGAVLISIAAGISTDSIRKSVGHSVGIVRVMPNTPALALEGASAVYFSPDISEADKETVVSLLNSFGKAYIVEREELMDAVTGLSGSGPAYVAMFVEALAEGGVKMGLSRELALKLAAQTTLGSAKILVDQSINPAALKDMVSSPGGTTIEGIKALEEKGFRAAVMGAVEAAAKRSKELSKECG